MARKSSLFQSSERFLALEEVLRWLKEVLKWLEEVLKWLEEVLNLSPNRPCRRADGRDKQKTSGES